MRMLGKFAVFFTKVFLELNLTIVFQDVTQNANWNKCMDVNGSSLARCIYNCEDNGNCEAACVEQFKTRTDDCPCEVNSVLLFIIYSLPFESL